MFWCLKNSRQQSDSELERKIRAAHYVNSALRQESEELDIAQAQLENFSKQLDGMQEAFRECGGVKQCIVSMHEKAEEVHHLIAEGINAGTFQVQVLKGLPSLLDISLAIEQQKEQYRYTS